MRLDRGRAVETTMQKGSGITMAEPIFSRVAHASANQAGTIDSDSELCSMFDLAYSSCLQKATHYRQTHKQVRQAYHGHFISHLNIPVRI
jgi:hypothetical protein